MQYTDDDDRTIDSENTGKFLFHLVLQDYYLKDAKIA